MAQIPFQKDNFNEIKNDLTVLDNGKTMSQIMQIDGGIEPQDDTITALANIDLNQFEGRDTKFVEISAKAWRAMFDNAVSKSLEKVKANLGIASAFLLAQQPVIFAPALNYIKAPRDLKGGTTEVISGIGAVPGKEVIISIQSEKQAPVLTFDASNISAGDYTAGVTVQAVGFSGGFFKLFNTNTQNSIAEVAAFLTANTTNLTWAASGNNLTAVLTDPNVITAAINELRLQRQSDNTVEKIFGLKTLPALDVDILETVIADSGGQFSKAVVIPNVSQVTPVIETITQEVATASETSVLGGIQHKEVHEINVIP